MKRCPHISPRYNRRGMACPECLSKRVAAEEHPAEATREPRPGFGTPPPPGVRRLCDHLMRLQHQYPGLVFHIPKLRGTPTEAEADDIAAQLEQFARKAYGEPEPTGKTLSRDVCDRAKGQLEHLRLQEQERALRAQQERLEREEAAVAEHWIAIQQREKTFAAQELRLAQRTDWTVLGVAAVSLLATFGPPPTVEARFLATLLVASVTAWWFGGRHWLGGDLDAFQASPVGCGWTVLRALAGRVVGATRRSSAAAGSGR